MKRFSIFSIFVVFLLVMSLNMTSCGLFDEDDDDDFVAVTGITISSSAATVGSPLTLSGTVSPSNATNKTITWSLVSEGDTGAELSGSTLTTNAAGTAVVRATITNGSARGSDYYTNFNIAVSAETPDNNETFVPVESITGVPGSGNVGNLTLGGTVNPENASNKNIVWSVKTAGNTGATINGSTLATSGTGTVTVTATIGNGKAVGTAYTQDFSIQVNIAGFVAVTNITGVLSSGITETPLTLTGTVVPSNASINTITWSIHDARETGATLNGNVLNVPTAGTVTVRATIANGRVTGDYTQNFSIQINTKGPDTVFVDKAGGTQNQGFVDLKTALDSITTAGTYIVRISSDQSLLPYVFTGTAARSITLKAEGDPIVVQRSDVSDHGLFSIGEGITLTLDSGLTLIWPQLTLQRTIITVNIGGTLIMNNGAKISENAGSAVNITGGTFIMNGGEISKIIQSTTANWDSAVHVRDGGTFNMEGGLISWITNGVSVRDGGTFNMKDGIITENNDSGVRVREEGIFNMYGGRIILNRALNGGGVYIQGGTFNMNGGEIGGNTATYDSHGGGGVLITQGGTFTMNGGDIYQNSSESHGGGVRIGDGGGNFIMVNGKIYGNVAVGGGGGVSGTGTFTMNGGEISGNIAGHDGGGVGCRTIMNGGIITGNTAGRDGGGVWIQTFNTNESIFTMNGGEISGNSAGRNGGGVFSTSNFIKTGGTIYGSNANSVALRNTAESGNAVFSPRVSNGNNLLRESTAGPLQNMDSTIRNAGGGWEFF